MGNRPSARQRIADSPLSEQSLAATLRRVLPRRNNVGVIKFSELLEEAHHFNVSTNREFRRLMLRHRRAVIAGDREPLSPRDEKIYRSEHGNQYVNERLRRQYWFTWEGLTRLAFEMEFGERYADYVRKRYGV